MPAGITTEVLSLLSQQACKAKHSLQVWTLTFHQALAHCTQCTTRAGAWSKPAVCGAGPVPGAPHLAPPASCNRGCLLLWAPLVPIEAHARQLQPSWACSRSPSTAAVVPWLRGENLIREGHGRCWPLIMTKGNLLEYL